ncbi:MAG: hypothetical protein AB7E47_12330 [Desulfovibrionaceae bacterium]
MRALRNATSGAPLRLALAGPDEFLPLEPDPTLDWDQHALQLRALADAYAAMDYDLVALRPIEAERLGEAGAPLSSSFVTAYDTPATRVLLPEAGGVGIVVFPDIPSDASPPPDMIRSVGDAGRGLRATTRLVIGMSPWGHWQEQEFLDNSPDVFDILLGSGNGGGLTARAEARDSTVWARSYTKGKVLQELDILAWPDHKGTQRWIMDETIGYGYTSLGEEIKDDKAIKRLFAF